MTPPACMILAAGFGTRMGALTQTRPKPLIEVGGRALIDHALDLARAAGVPRIVVNGHYHADQMQAHLAGMEDVEFSLEYPEILDSAGGIRAALLFLRSDPVVTLNADAVWTGANAIDELMAAWNPVEMDILCLLVDKDQTVGQLDGKYLAVDDAGRIRRDPEGHVYTGAQILKPGLLEGYPEGPFSLHEVWAKAMEAGRMKGVLHQGRWADVGRPQGIALAEAMLQEDGDV